MVETDRRCRALLTAVLAAATALSVAAAHASSHEGNASDGRRADPLGQTISLDVQDADLVNVLRMIADVTDLNVIIDPSIQGKVTLKLEDVAWDRFLGLVLRMYGLDSLRDGNILLIAPADHPAMKAPAPQTDTGPIYTRMIRVNHASAADLKPILESAALSPDGVISVDERTNTLIIRDHASNIRDAIRLIGHD